MSKKLRAGAMLVGVILFWVFLYDFWSDQRAMRGAEAACGAEGVKSINTKGFLSVEFICNNDASYKN